MSAASSREHTPHAWSRRLVTLFGIDLYIHATFLLLVAFLVLGNVAAGQSGVAVLRAVLLMIAVFAAVVAHELGHALVARRFGVRTLDITLFPIGGIARLENIPEKPARQLVIALAGPAVNLGIAAGLMLVLVITKLGLDSSSFTGAPFLAQLLWINLSLAAFNLVPGFPMDGGRVLRALLAMRLPPERATEIAARVGQGVAVVFGLLGLFFSPFLIVIGIFVWFGAQAEQSASKLKAALRGLSVQSAMITRFSSVGPEDTLASVVDRTLAGFQQDFPVVAGTKLVGVLTYANLLRGLATSGLAQRVGDVMTIDVERANPREPLEDALIRLYQEDRRVIAVMEGEALLGLLTIGNIGELLALGAAEREAPGVKFSGGMTAGGMAR